MDLIADSLIPKVDVKTGSDYSDGKRIKYIINCIDLEKVIGGQPCLSIQQFAQPSIMPVFFFFKSLGPYCLLPHLKNAMFQNTIPCPHPTMHQDKSLNQIFQKRNLDKPI